MADLTVWEDALDRLDVEWCDGRGCTRGSRDQHWAGFRSSDTVHMAVPPGEDEDHRVELHSALRLVGQVAAERLLPDVEGRVRRRAAFDFATDTMRAHGMSVPRDVLDLRPEGAEAVALYQVDEDAEAEAPGMVEADREDD